MRKSDRLIRRFIPSVVPVSKNYVFGRTLDIIDRLIPMPFPELKNLPPNRFRLRIGVENSVLFNHLKYRYRGINFWFYVFASGFCNLESNILDIGCGCGRNAINLKEYKYLGNSKFKGNYIGVDVDPEMIDWCKNNFPPENFTFLLVDTYSKIYNPQGDQHTKKFKLPIEAETQDFVFAMSLFTHLLQEDLAQYLEEAFRLMKKEAYLMGTVFCIDDLRESNSLGGRWSFKHSLGKAYIESQEFPEAAVAYERNYLIEICKNIGFETVEVTDDAKGGNRANDLLICKK